MNTSQIAHIFDSSGSDILSHLQHHILALSWIDQLLIPQTVGDTRSEKYDVRQQLISGFLYVAGGQYFFVSAGHIFNNIECATQAGRHVIKSAILDHPDSPGPSHIPIAPKDWQPKESHLSMWNKDAGVDFAAFHIPLLHSALINKGKTRAIKPRQVAKLNEEFDFYALLGFPSETKEFVRNTWHGGGEFRASFGLPLIPIEKVECHDCLHGFKDGFIGKILGMTGLIDNEEYTLQDIVGMSGGPIFGFRLEESVLHYRLVAIQSSWVESKQVIAGTHFRFCAETLAKCVRAKRTELINTHKVLSI